MIIKLYKNKRKVVCYIRFYENTNTYIVCTGKPSDYSCICWSYDNLTSAENTANEYVSNLKESLSNIL